MLKLVTATFALALAAPAWSATLLLDKKITPWEKDRVFTERPVFAFSAVPVGEDKSVLALGGRGFFLSTDVLFPMGTFDLTYLRGIDERFDFEVRLSTLGAMTLFEGGARMHVVGDETAALGVRAGATTLLMILAGAEGASVAAAFGLTPGLVISGGSRDVQVIAGVDFPMYFAGAIASTEGRGSGAAGLAVLVRPSLTVEVPFGKDKSAFVQSQLYWTSAPVAIPTPGGASASLVFFTLAAGVSF